MKYKLHKLEQFRHIKRIGKCDTLSIGNAKVVWLRVEEEVNGDIFVIFVFILSGRSTVDSILQSGVPLFVYCSVGDSLGG